MDGNGTDRILLEPCNYCAIARQSLQKLEAALNGASHVSIQGCEMSLKGGHLRLMAKITCTQCKDLGSVPTKHGREVLELLRIEAARLEWDKEVAANEVPL